MDLDMLDTFFPAPSKTKPKAEWLFRNNHRVGKAKYIPKYLSIMRVIDRRFETGEIFIKWDESPDEDWLILIYIKDNSPDKGIVIEDKSNPEKNLSHEFKSTEIFKASDLMVDSLTQLISKIRSKKS